VTPVASMNAESWMVETDGLRRSFVGSQRGTRVRAVDGLSITVRSGETFGLLGADGAGKSTTLRLLNGLLLPDGGTARVAGFDVAREARLIHQRAGYMPQQFALYGDLSVAENLELFARVHGLTAEQERQRIPRLLDFARLGPFRSRLAAHLSGGMKKKLALACMLAHDPEIVFLDEPTLGVDPVSRREFWALLSDLRIERGLTIFVCTPYMDEAERCHRVGLMYRGHLIACDTPQAIKSKVPGEALEVRPSDPFGARDVISGLEGVLEAETYGSVLHVFVDHAQQRSAELRGALEANGIAVSGIRTIAPQMEDAFVWMIRRQERDGNVGGRA
jgi:ABC-2 type transport system ATP-binding protein